MSGLILGVGVIGSLVLKMYKVARRVEESIGTDQNGRTVSERMSRVEYQLWENDGGSLKDQVNEIEKSGKIMASEVQFMKDLLLQLVGSHEIKPKKSKRSAA